MIGTLLDGRFRILRKIGEGAMGEVYLAEHVRLHRREALKVLLPQFEPHAAFLSRFRREARAVNRLQHPNIVTIYDYGQLPNGRFYLSMEYVEGTRLDEVLRRTGPLAVPRAVHLLSQLADAVDHAHARGVVHRDLKPSNLVSSPGRPENVKVLDFGLAKILSDDREHRRVTLRGSVFGTPAYMSPEQCEGITDDPRSDLYAIGVTAFELLTGQLVFDGSPLEVADQHLDTPPDPPSKRLPTGGIPPEVDQVVLKCLEKDPAQRYQTGREIVASLKDVPGLLQTGRSRMRRTVTPDRRSTPPPDRRSSSGPDTLEAEFFDTQVSVPLAMDLITAEAARGELHEATRLLADALLDAGHSDVQLLVGLTNVRQLENDLAALETQQETCLSRQEAALLAAREREGALRFAIGELRFERAQCLAERRPLPKDVDFQIAELERRVFEVAQQDDREQAALSDESAQLAVQWREKDEELRALEDSFVRLVEELLPTYLEFPAVRSPAERFRRAREGARRALQAAQ
jgi:serine/threonine protein kinase